MKRSRNKSNWGEWPETYDAKYQIHDVFTAFEPEKRTQVEMLGPIDEPDTDTTVQIENHLVTQTVELMNHTNRINSMIDSYNEDFEYIASQRHVLPTITLSDDTKVCLEELDTPIESPFNMRTVPTDFTLGRPKCPPSISKPIVDDVLAQTITGLLRIKGFDSCTESSLKTFTDGVGEFYKCLFDKINQVLSTQGKDVNKTLDVVTLDTAYKAIANKPLINLHNYYKNEIIFRNRKEILRFKNVHHEYDKIVEESEQIQKIQLKEEYMHMINNMSPSDSNANDSDASSYRDSSNMSYDARHYSDDNTSYYGQ